MTPGFLMFVLSAVSIRERDSIVRYLMAAYVV